MGAAGAENAHSALDIGIRTVFLPTTGVSVVLRGDIGVEVFVADGNGDVDVVVSDGFTGNVLLKATEGVIKFMMKALKGVFYKSTPNKLAAAVLKKDLTAMKKSMDVNEVGGTALVGISKPVVKAHGSSNAASFFAAIRQAKIFAESGIIEDIKENIDYMKIKAEKSE